MCTHNWTIESQNGKKKSKGICKLCGEEKMFLSYSGYFQTLTKKDIRNLEHMRALGLNEVSFTKSVRS